MGHSASTNSGHSRRSSHTANRHSNQADPGPSNSGTPLEPGLGTCLEDAAAAAVNAILIAAGDAADRGRQRQHLHQQQQQRQGCEQGEQPHSQQQRAAPYVYMQEPQAGHDGRDQQGPAQDPPALHAMPASGPMTVEEARRLWLQLPITEGRGEHLDAAAVTAPGGGTAAAAAVAGRPASGGAGNGEEGGVDGEADIGRQVPPGLLMRVLSFLPPNEQALTGRLVCRDGAEGLTEPCPVTLDQPLPPYVAPVLVASAAVASSGSSSGSSSSGGGGGVGGGFLGPGSCAQAALHALPHKRRLALLAAAAASGCEANLEVAWALVQPSMLAGHTYRLQPDPGAAAVAAGHPHLLLWMAARGWPMDARVAMIAAAEHCCLDDLRHAWAVLRTCSEREDSGLLFPSLPIPLPALQLSADMFAAVLQSAGSTVDAIAKLEWMDAEHDRHWRRSGVGAPGSGRGIVAVPPLQGTGVAAAAARSGDVARLLWLESKGVQLAAGGQAAVEATAEALRCGNLDLATWLAARVVAGLWRDP